MKREVILDAPNNCGLSGFEFSFGDEDEIEPIPIIAENFDESELEFSFGNEDESSRQNIFHDRPKYHQKRLKIKTDGN